MRNAIIFDGAWPSVHLWTVKLKEQILLQLLRYKDDLRFFFGLWLDSVL